MLCRLSYIFSIKSTGYRLKIKYINYIYFLIFYWNFQKYFETFLMIFDTRFKML